MLHRQLREIAALFALKARTERVLAEATMSERDLFIAALKISEPAERSAWLDRECGVDAVLRQRIDVLLQAFDKAGSLLENPVVDVGPTVDQPAREGPGTVIGPYKLLEQIGEGGFGVVYMAEQTEPVRRKVALKVLKPGMDTRQVVARFEAERQALAIMDHPNIARVFDGGTTDSPFSPGGRGVGGEGQGRPYFVMELVKGVPITDFCDQNHLTPRDRLELFVPVCQAVQHAHQKGIIHRDLKPSNILVSRHDTTPMVKVIDFGVAKALGQELTDKTLFTAIAQMVGTPLYMSPEQAGMSDLDVDTRSDIYSLGVLLYELLTGTTPFTKERFKQAAYDEIRRIIREEEPPRPSTRLSESKESLPSISARRQTEPAKLTKLVKGELDWIVMKALEKDRNRRYETANGFAADVQRYLADEPVQACPPSMAYRFRKFARRNRVALLTMGLVAFTLLFGLGISLWQAVRATRAQEAEARQRNRAQANLRLSLESLDEMYTELAMKRLAQRPDLKELQRQYLQRALVFYQRFAKENSDDPTVRFETAKAFHRVGDIQHELGHAREAMDALNQARSLYEVILADTDKDADPKRRLGLCLNRLAVILTDLGRFPEAGAASDQGYRIWNELTPRFPDDPRYQELRLINRGDAARLRNRRGQRLEAATLYKQVIADLTAAVQANAAHRRFQHLLATNLVNLGAVLSECGPKHWPEARSAYESALTRLEGLIKRSPDNPSYRSDLALVRYNLGVLFHRMGDFGREETMLRAALGLYQELVDRYPSVADYRHELARSHLALGLMLTATNRLQEAEKSLSGAVALYGRLARQSPDLVEHRARLAQSELNLGTVLAGTKRLARAVKLWSHALSLFEELLRRFPSNDGYRGGVAACRQCLAEAHEQRGETARAEHFYRQSLDLLEELSKRCPETDGYPNALARCHYSLAVLLLKAGRDRDAQPEFRRAAEYLRKLMARHPNTPEHRFHLAVCHNNLGAFLRDRNKKKEAHAEFMQALAVYPEHVAAASNLVWQLCIGADASSDETKRARELAQFLVRKAPENGDHQRRLGMACYRVGDWKGAALAFQKTSKLHNGLEAVDAFFLAMALHKLGEPAVARKVYDLGLGWLAHQKAQLARLELLSEELSQLRSEAVQALGIQEETDGR
jgi:serine/threonine protein kinase/Tfp pilus assembly protein PilF